MTEHGGATVTELPVSLTLDRHVYMSTLSDLLNGRMAKLDVSPGTVSLAMFKNKSKDSQQGFLFKRAEFDINLHKMEQILECRKGAYGLGGTYYCGESNHPDHLRFLNDHFAEHLSLFYFPEPNSEDDLEEYCDDEYSNSNSTDGESGNTEETCSKDVNSGCNGDYNVMYDDSRSSIEEEENFYDSDGNFNYDAYQKKRRKALGETKRKFKRLDENHNLPILFFLKCEPANDDDTDENACKLKDITLKKVEKETHPFIVWQVNGKGEELGYAIQMENLMNTAGDPASIAVFGNAVAFGNYVPDRNYENYKEEDDYLWHGYFVYKCKIKPCTCRLYYENTCKRRKIN
ncbi:hypothetical protein O0L34_g18557 [Tuta absoluta]|nr:hypothetical protein O0L34_g18557 [Tuta absoluta]